jgi:hypothetical protein
MAEVRELRAGADRVEHRVEVVPLVAQRHALCGRAQLHGVDDVARKGRPAADDVVAGPKSELREAVDHTVGPGSDRHFLEAHTVHLGERRTEAVRAAVRVAVQLPARALQCSERRRHGPVGPLVRRELDHPLEAELPLDLLDRLAGLVRHDPGHRGSEEAVGDLRERHGMRAYSTV